MKKLIVTAMILVFTLCAISGALAETLSAGSRSVTIPDTLEAFDPEFDDDEDAEACVGAYYDENLEIVAYYFDGDGMTPEEYLAEYAEDTDVQSGVTTINGIPCVYFVVNGSDETGDYTVVTYAAQDGEYYFLIDFYLTTKQDNDTVLAIMNSLK